MSESFNVPAAVGKIGAAIRELDAIMEEFSNDRLSAEGLVQRLQRWKDRTEVTLRDISEDDAETFARLRITPSWVGMEEPFALIRDHREFLEALAHDIAEHSDAWDRKHRERLALERALNERAAAERDERIPRELEPPEHFTAGWIWNHAPASFWVWVASGLAAIFGLGMALERWPIQHGIDVRP